MNDDELWDRLSRARVGVLGTIRPDGTAHQVPFVFAASGGRQLVTAVDGKPKRGRRLARLQHIETDPRVSVLVQHYSDDWSALWWVRAEGRGAVADQVSADQLGALTRKYRQYVGHELGPFVVIEIDRLAGWSAAG